MDAEPEKTPRRQLSDDQRQLLSLLEEGGAEAWNTKIAEVDREWLVVWLDFSHIDFPGPVDFAGCRFPAPVSFSGATFKDEATFREASFEAEAMFSEATFGGGDFQVEGRQVWPFAPSPPKPDLRERSTPSLDGALDPVWTEQLLTAPHILW